MGFICIHTTRGTEMWLNVSHIVAFYKVEGEGHVYTSLWDSTGDEYEVKETVEEITNMLESL